MRILSESSHDDFRDLERSLMFEEIEIEHQLDPIEETAEENRRPITIEVEDVNSDPV